ncbi:hypothetical protein HNQ92_005090 [Rhabdobacter roseus]|uniref:WbqC family protein n=1 Tax=Rhabdobacter roseus TaxID=1655419 RepID=A0A840U3M4_9BACT|nr:WbqC family protein [Rhabdobacter roseus]MBB5286928.1 hypothetical protein [Rhabdobacter roseus]
MADVITQNHPAQDVLIELHYLPCLDYFACLLSHRAVWLEAHESYPKQTYRNRCRVLTTNKVDTLTVPVQAGRSRQLMRDVKIDYGQAWIRRHWGCFRAAYGKSPFFEYYAPELEAVFQQKPIFLADLNERLLTICLRLLGITKNVQYTLSYEKEATSTIFDARSLISDKNGPESTIFMKKVPYYQTFGNDFLTNLSIVDLLFNQGPEARHILTESLRAPIGV